MSSGFEILQLILVVKLSQCITSLAREVESEGVTEDCDGWIKN